uniref:Uncharacterized protein LOC111101013 n=1 Tax=Crassostrea virginica TaxID=6565 RepID=A0A8B8ACP2_CRAVI|nr:uncharacterized protein LOC111101013 [Crassostrea virginica]
MGNTTAAPFEAQVSNNGDSSTCIDAEDESLLIRPCNSSKGKRRAQPLCDGTVHSETQRLIEIEEEKLTIKRKRLAVEQEKLEVMKNCLDLLQTYCISSQSAQNLLSSM